VLWSGLGGASGMGWLNRFVRAWVCAERTPMLVNRCNIDIQYIYI
jgi:hypothetical protein